MSFLCARSIKATRKQHQCEGCGKNIEAPAPAWYFSMVYDGEFSSGYYHIDCRTAEDELNALKGGYSSDDWVPLWEIRNEPDDCDWLIEAHPSVAARMGLNGGAA